jgi:hypothetical protein
MRMVILLAAYLMTIDLALHWRSGPVEDIHAGRFSAYPLTQRRITPSEERMLMREASGRLAQGVIAISSLLCEKSERSWPERVLPFHLVPYWMATPSNWSLEQQTIDFLLPGRELLLGSTDWNEEDK